MAKIRLLELSGTPFELGYQHGAAFAGAIRELTQERLQLSSSLAWTGKELPRSDVLALAEACLPYHEAYDPALLEELRGMSEATGIGLAELVILNGFTDFVDTVYSCSPAVPPAHPGLDDCTAFIVSPDATAEGQGFFGQTWDMHETATPHLIMLRGRPAADKQSGRQSPAFLTMTIAGCLGMIGMNEAGIAIGVNNLLGGDGRVGVTWPFVIRQALAQTSLDAALACITGARLAGAHNYLLADGSGRGYNVEAMASRYTIQEVTRNSLVHTNHCLAQANIEVERARLPKSRASSVTRLSRAGELLSRPALTLDDLVALTRDHGADNGICAHPEAPFFLESCGAAIMRPATRDMWAVWGRPCQNEYERFTV